MKHKTIISTIVLFIVLALVGIPGQLVEASKPPEAKIDDPTLPFGLKWGQTKAEVSKVLSALGQPLTKLNNTLYFVTVFGNRYSTSTHFTFKSNKLYWIIIMGMCNDAACANFKFNSVYTVLENSKYKKLHSDREKSKHIYYDKFTNSYVQLKGFIDRDKYIVLLEYEDGKTSSMKRYNK